LPKESVAGRWAYLHALHRHWPEVLDSLRINVAPVFTPKWVENNRGEKLITVETWQSCRDDSSRTELVSALRDWASRFGFTEDWLFHTALYTLLVYSPDNYATYQAHDIYRTDNWRWHYHPIIVMSEERVKPFAPTFGHDSIWSAGGGETWDTFRRRMEGKFNQQLTEYREAAEALVDTTQSEKFDLHAEWTVRYQHGELAQEIAKELKGFDDAEQTVYRAINRFAKRIGLNLKRRKLYLR
jgi:hypothetical protein